MYKIIGGDKKEYGPVEADQLRRWFVEGRVNGQTLVQGPGSLDWRPLETYPELAPISSTPPPAETVTDPAWHSTLPGAPVPLADGDYDLDVGACVSQGWALLKANFGLLFGGVAIFMLIQGGIALLGQIPLIGILVSLVSIILGGPITGGLYYFLLRVVRGEPAEIGDIFAGFRINFGQLVLVYLVMALLVVVMMIPGAVVAAIAIFKMTHTHQMDATSVVMATIGSLVALVPVIYFGVSWLFAIPLVIDKHLDFWPALMHSRKMVSKHWWSVFALMILTSVINLGGLAICCIGVFFTSPLAFAALACGYEKIFNGSPRSTSVAS